MRAGGGGSYHACTILQSSQTHFKPIFSISEEEKKQFR